MRRYDERDTQPAGSPANLPLSAGKDNVLPQCAQHLHGERFVAHRKIEAMAEALQRTAHMIALELIWVGDARPQMRVGVHH